MHRIALLALLLAAAELGQCIVIRGDRVVIQAVYPSSDTPTAVSTTDPTLIDQEDDDIDGEIPEEGSGCTDGCGWVRHHINGQTFFARPSELDSLEDFLKRSEIPLLYDQVVASSRGRQMEDGPSLSIDEITRHNPVGVARPVAQGQSLEEISSSNFYPEYAIGIMDNGCTGFLISPFHVLTAAHCVYDHTTDTWNEDLQFFRGRNVDKYLDVIDWVNVLIPFEYYTAGDEEHNWAMITYNKRSPVWIRIAHSPQISDLTYTLYGYLNDKTWGGLYSTVCRSDMYQPSAECIAMQCGADEKISGGPAVRGYNFQRSRMPMAFGVSVNAEEYSYAHNVVRFTSKLFWTLCYFTTNANHDPKCRLQ